MRMRNTTGKAEEGMSGQNSEIIRTRTTIITRTAVGTRAVSYTHLDVYKRQFLDCIGSKYILYKLYLLIITLYLLVLRHYHCKCYTFLSLPFSGYSNITVKKTYFIYTVNVKFFVDRPWVESILLCNIDSYR